MADNANKEIKTATADDGSTGYEMKIGLGTIAMLISATGMGLVPLFSRWATRTDMFDGALGLNAGDSIGALMAVGRMSMGVLFFVVIMFATGKVETFKKLKLTPAIALGGLMIGMSLACYVTSTLLTTISNAVLFIYIGPVVCVVLARIFRKEPMSALQWVCLVAVSIGMLFGNNLMGFNESGFFVDFNLVPSTPEFPQKVSATPSAWLPASSTALRCSSTATVRTPTPRLVVCGTSSSPSWALVLSPSS